METYDIIIRSIGCSGPGKVFLANQLRLPPGAAPSLACTRVAWTKRPRERLDVTSNLPDDAFLLRANYGLMHRSKRLPHSITSSARRAAWVGFP
jgi:hypothetical protein